MELLSEVKEELNDENEDEVEETTKDSSESERLHAFIVHIFFFLRTSVSVSALYFLIPFCFLPG